MRFASPRPGMGPVRITIVVVLLGIIAAGEYNWLTTPWALLAVKICGPAGIGPLLDDVVNWVRNLL